MSGAPVAEAAPPPLLVHASVTPVAVPFGARAEATVVVDLDPARVAAGSLRVTIRLAPFGVAGPVRVTRIRNGDRLVVTYVRAVSCESVACLATRGDAHVRLPRALVRATARGGAALTAAAVWPVVDVRRRVPPAAVRAARVPFRIVTSPPPVSYRVAPSRAAAVLDGVAVAAAIGALALLVGAFVRVRQRTRVVHEGELERALRLALAAADRSVPDRRRALGWLARVLDRSDTPLAGGVRDLAWSRPAPQPEQVSAAVTEVDREVSA